MFSLSTALLLPKILLCHVFFIIHLNIFSILILSLTFDYLELYNFQATGISFFFSQKENNQSGISNYIFIIEF